MKKIVWIAIIATIATLVAVSLSSFSMPTLDDKFEEAGRVALAEGEAILIQMKEEIESLVWEAARDQIVTKYEMINLRNLVSDFVETKSKFNSELKIYGLEISTSLGEGYEKAIDAYFGGNILFREDNENEDARIFFVSQTGLDVTVKRGAVIDGDTIFPIIIAIVFLVATVFLGITDSPWGILTGFGFAIFVILILIV